MKNKERNNQHFLLSALFMLFLIAFPFGNLSAQNKDVSVSVKNVTLKQLFDQIEKTSSYRFAYIDNILPTSNDISITVKDEPIGSVLNKVLSPRNMTYIQMGNTYSISKKVKAGINKKLLSGTVTDPTGEPVIGANVLVEGTTIGTVTDFEGNFKLDVPENAKLKVSYIGMSDMIVDTKDKNFLSIKMVDNSKALDEIVVVGYGTQKKVNLTGSVESVSVKDVSKRMVGQTSSALQGLIPGVSVTQQSGQPGLDGGAINVRGLTTFGNNSVLVLVDGVEMSINDLNPSLIESISVLKDAASAAIYGSRAANGVILITTNRAEVDKFNVSYSTQLGWQNPTALPKKLNAIDHMTLLDLANINVGNSPIFGEDKIAAYREGMNTNPDLYPNTDWYKEVLSKNGFSQNHFLSISGGSKRIRTIASFGYMGQNGVVENSKYERFTFRVNTDMEVLKGLKASVDANATYGKRNAPTNPDIFNWLTRIPSNEVGMLSSGKYGVGWNGENPIAMAKDGGVTQVTTPNLILNLGLVYNPIKELTIKASYAPSYYETNESSYLRSIQTYNPDGSLAYTKPSQASLMMINTNVLHQLLTASATFEKTFGVNHLNLLAGYQQDTYRFDTFLGSRIDFPFEDFPILDAGGVEGQKSGGNARESALLSGFGRLNYALYDRYLFEANVRIDASSKFAKGKRTGVFPSFSAGWRISEESFWKTIKPVINNFKLRGSWGQLGNQNTGNNFYPYASTVSIDGMNYVFDNKAASGAALAVLGNSNITWETTSVTNLGLDLNFWNKLNASFDWYYKRTKDILMTLDIPLIIGMNAPYQNAGVVENKGWDLNISYNDQVEGFNYRIAFNLSDVRNKILDMKGVSRGDLIINMEGEEMNSIFGLKSIGYITADDFDSNGNYLHATQYDAVAPGDIRYLDLNEDGQINSDDRMVLGGTIPRFTYGLSLSAGYKDFDISVLFQGVGKANGYLEGHGIQPFFEGGTAQEQHKDYWTPENPDAKFPRLTFGRTNNTKQSSFWMKNAAYCRLKNLQIGYTLPKKWTTKAYLNNVRVYFSGDNLFTISDFWDGFDVEAPIGIGNYYPQMKVFSFGLQLNI